MARIASRDAQPVSSRYGAPMGRPSRPSPGDVDHLGPLTLRRVPLDSGGYDRGGAYWGIGAPLFWCASDDGTFDTFLRARDRDAAKAEILDDNPGARFKR